MKINKKANSRFDFVIKNNILSKSKRSQVTIFIIFGLILIVSMVLLFILIKKPDFQVEDVENPQAYIESCVRDAVEEAIEILSKQGGDITPKGSVMYQGENITYLCYNANYYVPCVNQRPLLIEHIEGEITNYISPKVNTCFDNLKTELERKNYGIVIGEMKLNTKLQTNQVVVDINRDFKMTKRDEAREFKNFKAGLMHSIYELAKVSSNIVNQEARFCNFDILSYMIFYPEYNLDKFRTGDSDIIYTIRERRSGDKFVFAVKSCTLPPGF